MQFNPFGSAILAGAFFVAVPAFAQDNSKKLIEYGWDVPCATFVESHIAQMEQQPFDGIAFTVNCGTSGPFYNGIPVLFDSTLWTASEMQLNVLSAIQWHKFTNNFLPLWSAQGSVNPDWFNDSHWNVITANLQLYAKAAHTAHAVGLLFDTEPYLSNPWAYSASQFSGYTFAQVQAQVRKRGAQFMTAVQKQLPNPQILLLNGPSWLLQQYDWVNGDESQMPDSLLLPFLNGMLDVISSGGTLIDGNETSYYFDSTTLYFTYPPFIRSASSIFPPSSATAYANHVQVANALYLDALLGQLPATLSNGQPNPILPAYYGQLGRNDFEAWTWHNVYNGLANSDKYVWCYSENMNWWTGNIFPGAVNAIETARNQLAAGQPLGFDLVKANFSDSSQRPRVDTSETFALDVSPVNGGASGAVLLTAELTPNANTVFAFYLDSNLLGYSTSGFYNATTPAGHHVYRARAFNTNGSTGTSQPIGKSN